MKNENLILKNSFSASLKRALTLYSVTNALLGIGCRTETHTLPPASAERGRIIYQTQCIACHNSNPKKPGSLGPDVFGSSKDLLEARILKGEYPTGYAPKRNSHVMAALPHLKGELESLYLFLNAIDTPSEAAPLPQGK